MVKICDLISPRKPYCWIAIFLGCWFIGGTAYNWSLVPFAGIFGEIDNLENVFSPVNALFSAIASGGAIYAILLQVKIISDQQVETLFYNMLNIHRANRDVVSATKVKANPSEVQDVESELAIGLTAFKVLHERLEALVTVYYDELPDKHTQYVRREDEMMLGYLAQSEVKPEQQFCVLYDIFTESTDHCLSQYFTHLYHIIKFIDERVVDANERNKYFSFIRAQLSPYEYTLFYYNGLANGDSRDGETISKVKKLIEKNCLMHTLVTSLRFDEGYAGEYDESAFDH